MTCPKSTLLVRPPLSRGHDWSRLNHIKFLPWAWYLAHWGWFSSLHLEPLDWSLATTFITHGPFPASLPLSLSEGVGDSLGRYRHGTVHSYKFREKDKNSYSIHSTVQTDTVFVGSVASSWPDQYRNSTLEATFSQTWYQEQWSMDTNTREWFKAVPSPAARRYSGLCSSQRLKSIICAHKCPNYKENIEDGLCLQPVPLRIHLGPRMVLTSLFVRAKRLGHSERHQ